MLGYRKKLTEQGALTNWRQQREGVSGHRKKPTKKGVLTLWRCQRDGVVRT